MRFQPPMQPSGIMEKARGESQVLCLSAPRPPMAHHMPENARTAGYDIFSKSVPWPKSPFFIGVLPKGEWHTPPALAPHSPRLKEPHLCKALLHKVFLHSLSATYRSHLHHVAHSPRSSYDAPTPTPTPHSPKSWPKAVVIENARMVQQDVQPRSHALRSKCRT